MKKVWLTLVGCIILLATLVGNATAQTNLPPSATGAAAVLSKPGGKLSFRLEALASSTALQTSSAEDLARSLSLPAQGAGSLMRDAQGRLLVDIRMSDLSEAQLQALQSLGAQVIHTSDRYRVATVLVSPGDLTAIANLPSVQSVMEELAPQVGSSPQATSPLVVGAPQVTCPQGSYVSEGDAQLKADQARSTYSLDGNGVKIGILSDFTTIPFIPARTPLLISLPAICPASATHADIRPRSMF